MRDTIFALSSGSPPAGVAVVRISGPGVRFGLETVVGVVPPARRAHLAHLRDESGQVLDHGLILFFPGPKSFTGEDVAELQIHGGRASVSAVLAVLSKLPGFRLAEPGEYTKRAFENGRMDLTAVEGLSDLIRAETESQRRQAVGQAEGALRELYEAWARRITHARAMVEAELDFSDEEDIPGSVTDRIWPEMQALVTELSAHLSRAKAGEIVRDGFRIALIGPPNAGKSSLLNAVARRDAAIVSDIPGTTRDIVEVRLDIDGHLVLLQDTAGLREARDEIEQEGIRRSVAAAETADLVLELCDVRETRNVPKFTVSPDVRSIRIWSKSDLLHDGSVADGELLVSSKSGEGIDALLSLIGRAISESMGNTGEILPTRERHVQYLGICKRELEAAVSGGYLPIEVRSEYLRNAAVALGRITGSVDVEDLLGVIFSEFCVGK
ncbi:tRNA uridine-5-carboxymethylaminomethyl(34) synthesis GTPase MnmE [Hoeflea alexandrii]|uniref:tRNA uridine-5-carboxymethylaminomethyl(34) synthesis GTPase MnmE n=1 Tax=Hoeflea alexandrii TaxID=288436 RepID=UPI0022AFD0DB|nr:tRNA uridine-5-carboxymethylaminomethyl(34) synthesis GTPase MnmE [Hoeflea alexandrii]MCZ4289519.1 tRNA uridine-5-carboxymethylaminomethyl(34) synthesis GTPase MnmE [Hoeflea alexandrii]